MNSRRSFLKLLPFLPFAHKALAAMKPNQPAVPVEIFQGRCYYRWCKFDLAHWHDVQNRYKSSLLKTQIDPKDFISEELMREITRRSREQQIIAKLWGD